jgi:hypothetical protein
LSGRAAYDALTYIAAGYASCGDYVKAREVSASIDNTTRRAEALGVIAGRLWENDEDKAFEVLAESATAARSIKEADDRARTGRRIAELLAETGQYDLAFRAAAMISEPEARIETFTELAVAHAGGGSSAEEVTPRDLHQVVRLLFHPG